jgi:hypothetical protein
MGDRVQCTWIDIPQAAHTAAVMLSRPWWMWGAEIGANEHGVVIGNEAVFTKGRYGDKALLGMDLLRLALERSRTAREAVGVIVDLLESHGQGGPCSYEHQGFTYDNSFLVADPGSAFVVETAGRHFATEEVRGPARSISNGHVGGLGRDPASSHPRGGLSGHRAGRPDGSAPRSRWLGGPSLVAHPRWPGCAVRPRRRHVGLQPDDRVVGLGPPRWAPALGHRHLGPLHLAVQAGPGGHPG